MKNIHFSNAALAWNLDFKGANYDCENDSETKKEAKREADSVAHKLQRVHKTFRKVARYTLPSNEKNLQ